MAHNLIRQALTVGTFDFLIWIVQNSDRTIHFAICGSMIHDLIRQALTIGTFDFSIWILMELFTLLYVSMIHDLIRQALTMGTFDFLI